MGATPDLDSGSVLRKIFQNALLVILLVAIVCGPSRSWAQAMKKVPLPFSPIGINCLPWFVAKEARIYEKNGIDVDPVFIGRLRP
jgi:ABC-type nitrate/sulfonate/bicarbonate transport system substrate-binding protein